MRERENNLDWLRAIAAIMVIVIHVSAGYVTSNMDNPNLDFTVGNFFDSFSRFAVPIFVMLSGAFLLNDNRNRDMRTFYKKMYKKLIIPTFCWSFIYVIYSAGIGLLVSYMNGSEYNYLLPILNWIKGEPFYHLWYLYMIIGIYLITPVLIKVIEKISLKMSLCLGSIFAISSIILNLSVELLWPFEFINYLGYFILGYSLKKMFERGNSNKAIFMALSVISAFLIFILTELIVRGDIQGVDQLYFYNYLSPFVIVGSIAIFSLFLNLKEIPYNKGISDLAKHSFNIYVIHVGVLNVFSIVINKLGFTFNPVIFIPIMSIVVLVISFGISVTLNKILNIVRSNISNEKVTTVLGL